jgi:hypothetical protein
MKVEGAMNLIELKERVKRALEQVKRIHYQNYFAYAYDKKQWRKSVQQNTGPLRFTSNY